jgi:hypothetical protein
MISRRDERDRGQPAGATQTGEYQLDIHVNASHTTVRASPIRNSWTPRPGHGHESKPKEPSLGLFTFQPGGPASQVREPWYPASTEPWAGAGSQAVSRWFETAPPAVTEVDSAHGF